MTTEEHILQAAAKVFTQKGFAAARMDEIAKEAGINRALLHYYFRSKAKMFEIIFEEHFMNFFSGIYGILSSTRPLFDKITDLVEHELSTLVKHPEIPNFVLNEINVNPERVINRINADGRSIMNALKVMDKQVQEEYSKGTIVKTEAFSLVINIMALCIYPFVAKNLIMGVSGKNLDEFLQIAMSRKNEIINMIINGIKA